MNARTMLPMTFEASGAASKESVSSANERGKIPRAWAFKGPGPLWATLLIGKKCFAHLTIALRSGPIGGPRAPPPPELWRPSALPPPCSNYNNAKRLQHVAVIVSVITLACMYNQQQTVTKSNIPCPLWRPLSLWPLPSVNAGATTGPRSL